MSTIYRAVFSDDRPDLVAGARGLFGSWLAGKGIDIEVPTAGRAEAEGQAVEVITAEDGDVPRSGCAWTRRTPGSGGRPS